MTKNFIVGMGQMDFMREANERFGQEAGSIGAQVDDLEQRVLEKSQQLLDSKYFENNREFERARQLHSELADLGFTLPQLKQGYQAVSGGIQRLRDSLNKAPRDPGVPRLVERSEAVPADEDLSHIENRATQPPDRDMNPMVAADEERAASSMVSRFKKTAGAVAEKVVPEAADALGAGAVGLGGYEVGRELGLGKGGSAALAAGEGAAALIMPEALPFIAAGDAAASFVHDLFGHHHKDRAPVAPSAPLVKTAFQTGDVAIPVTTRAAY